MSLKYGILKFGVACLRCVYAPIRAKKTRDKITFISRQSEEPSADIALLSDYIRENHRDVECSVMVKMIGPGLAGKLGYLFHMISQMKAIATSKVVVLDGYCIAASVLDHKPDLQILQMWHALAAIKKFGYQSLDKGSGHSSQIADIMCMHRNYDQIISASPATGQHFCEGFGYDRDRIRLYGLPRIDVIRRAVTGDRAEDFRAQVRAEYGVPEGQEIVLYVPTFRKGKQVDVDGVRKALDPKRFRLIVKLHPLHDDENISDTRYSTYEWLGACDRIITDYSALGVEAALAEKPLYFYVYDIEDYKEQVGLNVDPLTELPKASARTSEELAQAVNNDYDFDGLNRFREKYVSVDIEHCTEKLGEYIYGLTRKTL